MDGKYVLLLVVACSQNLVSAHILPSRHVDYPLVECVKTLTRHMLNLCPSYSDYTEIFFDNGMLIPREVGDSSWEQRERVIQTCCARPCTAAELLSIC